MAINPHCANDENIAVRPVTVVLIKSIVTVILKSCNIHVDNRNTGIKTFDRFADITYGFAKIRFHKFALPMDNIRMVM